MIICHSRRFIFIHVQRTGGTSVELALEPYLDWSDLILGSSDLGEVISYHFEFRYGIGKHSTIADIERVCGEQICRDYYIFATVRHPVDRLCSLYNYVGATVRDGLERAGIAADQAAARLADEFPLDAPSLGWEASRAFIATANFSEFIRHEELSSDPGFRDQVSRFRSLSDGRIAVQPFRLEDRSAWVPELQNSLGVDIVLPHLNQAPRKLIVPDEVSGEDRRYIEARFAEDYAAFGYDP